MGTVKESMELGKEAAEHISSQFPSPIKLEFEKVIHNYSKGIILCTVFKSNNN